MREFTRHPRRDGGDSAPDQRDETLKRLVAIGTNAVPSLLFELNYESVVAENVVRALTFGLRDFGQNDIRINAALGVEKIGPRSLPVLFDLLKSDDGRLRRSAASVLGKFYREDAQVIPSLIRALEDSDFGVRGHAALSLGEVGPDAKAAVAPILAWLKDIPSFPILLVVNEAVQKIDPGNSELITVLSRLARATNVPGLSRGELAAVKQLASKLVAEINRTSSLAH